MRLPLLLEGTASVGVSDFDLAIYQVRPGDKVSHSVAMSVLKFGVAGCAKALSVDRRDRHPARDYLRGRAPDKKQAINARLRCALTLS